MLLLLFRNRLLFDERPLLLLLLFLLFSFTCDLEESCRLEFINKFVLEFWWETIVFSFDLVSNNKSALKCSFKTGICRSPLKNKVNERNGKKNI